MTKPQCPMHTFSFYWALVIGALLVIGTWSLVILKCSTSPATLPPWSRARATARASGRPGPCRWPRSGFRRAGGRPLRRGSGRVMPRTLAASACPPAGGWTRAPGGLEQRGPRGLGAAGRIAAHTSAIRGSRNRYNPPMPPSPPFAGPLLLGLPCPTVSAQPRAEKRAKIEKTAVNVSAVKPGDKAKAAIVLEIKEGFHAQSRTPSQEYLIKFEVRLDPNDAVKFGDVVYPPGKDETYPKLGKLNVYTGRVVVIVPVEVKADAKPGPLKITGKLKYQICDDSVCYPPESPKFE